MTLINVQNMCKTYTTNGVDTPVLFDVDFKVKKGDFLAIMGPSGSGKSTLLNILGFLDVQSSGKYILNGLNNQEYTDNQMAEVRNSVFGFVFQSFNLLNKQTVLENVILPLHYSDMTHDKWEARARECIDMVGLSHRINHKCNMLSGGEKQRVAIARALVNNPAVLFADEPTGNLDSKSGQNVMQILQDLNEKHGHTILLITHEDYTSKHAKRIIRIRDGKIVSDKKNNTQVAAKTFIK